MAYQTFVSSCRFYRLRYSGVNCALGPSKSIRCSGVCFPIFYCNSARLSNVVRYNGVFVIARFVIAGFHCCRPRWLGFNAQTMHSFVVLFHRLKVVRLIILLVEEEGGRRSRSLRGNSFFRSKAVSRFEEYRFQTSH